MWDEWVWPALSFLGWCVCACVRVCVLCRRLSQRGVRTLS